MAAKGETGTQSRIPLSRERVVRAAIALADESGIEALTMRRLADELGVEAMSLYYHVANKEAILDGVVDGIVGEIEEAADGYRSPSTGSDWKAAARERILTAREVMLHHPWAPRVIETRTTISPSTMRYFDALVGLLREGGLSYDLIHHAMHALGSRALGFSQELFEPDDDTDAEEDLEAMFEQMGAELPYTVEMLMEVAHDDPDASLGWCDDQTEFRFALDLILDGLERLHESA